MMILIMWSLKKRVVNCKDIQYYSGVGALMRAEWWDWEEDRERTKRRTRDKHVSVSCTIYDRFQWTPLTYLIFLKKMKRFFLSLIYSSSPLQLHQLLKTTISCSVSFSYILSTTKYFYKYNYKQYERPRTNILYFSEKSTSNTEKP